MAENLPARSQDYGNIPDQSGLPAEESTRVRETLLQIMQFMHQPHVARFIKRDGESRAWVAGAYDHELGGLAVYLRRSFFTDEGSSSVRILAGYIASDQAGLPIEHGAMNIVDLSMYVTRDNRQFTVTAFGLHRIGFPETMLAKSDWTKYCEERQIAHETLGDLFTGGILSDAGLNPRMAGVRQMTSFPYGRISELLDGQPLPDPAISTKMGAFFHWRNPFYLIDTGPISSPDTLLPDSVSG